MSMESFKIEGELILVEPIMVKQNAMDEVGVFKGVVKILQFGEKADKEGYDVGQKVLIKYECNYKCPHTNEHYIYREQILRTVS